MKTLMFAGAAVAAIVVASPALAASSSDMFSPVTIYATGGYASTNVEGLGLGVLQGRLGAQFGKYVAVEGEAGFGVKKTTTDAFSPGIPIEFKVRDEEAIYGVGIVPLSPEFEVFGRVGYGHVALEGSSGGFSASAGGNGVAYGGGARVWFTMKDGLRGDYTRVHLNNGGGDADVWSIAYTRKF